MMMLDDMPRLMNSTCFNDRTEKTLCAVLTRNGCESSKVKMSFGILAKIISIRRALKAQYIIHKLTIVNTGTGCWCAKKDAGRANALRPSCPMTSNKIERK